MPKTIRYTLLSVRDMLTSVEPFVLLAILLMALTYWWLDPSPPKLIRLATGPAQSAYAEFGMRYAKAMAAYGIEVRLLPSDGSSQNLEWLKAGKTDLGFVQGGRNVLPGSLQVGLTSLGSLSH
jgi:TRAP-type uncharacterized transport system substrate-binding protein